MKTTVRFLGVVVLSILTIVGCSKKPTASSTWSVDKSQVSAQLKGFEVAQEKQARALMEKDGKPWPAEYGNFFRDAAKGDWQAATNSFEVLSRRAWEDTNLHCTAWSAMLDAYGVFELFPNGAEKYWIAFGNDIIQSIPPGSIYFGGADAGRFLVTALMESHADGKPFFMLSQNPLTDGTYLHYLQAMYGGKIYTLTDEDLQKCIQDYTTDAQRRLAHDQQYPREPKQLKPGEEVKLDSNGQIQLSSQMNVIGVRELLTKIVFDKNPDREFYIVEGFPLDWMYPYLEPHSLIMKLNRQPLAQLSDETVQADADYWSKYITPMIGNWLNKDTTVKDIAAFAEKVYTKQDLGGFTGDPQFVQSTDAQKEFSKLRSSIAGIYMWRAQNTKDALEKQRMSDAADFAFKQAWALCPYSLETVYRYINLLTKEGRADEALVVAQAAAKMPENGDRMATLHDVISNLQRSVNQK